MKTGKTEARIWSAIILVTGLWLAIPGNVSAHCDTLDGPVVATAKSALEKGDVTPVLKWIRKDNETEIRDLFKKTVSVRAKGKDAQELADRYFFETLVRIHRAGEGAPYTGLKPAGQVEPSIAAADKAIDSGSVDNLVKMITEDATEGIHQRYAAVQQAKKHADKSVAEGRKYVEAYVDFTHYVEALDLASASRAHHGPDQKKHEEIEVH